MKKRIEYPINVGYLHGSDSGSKCGYCNSFAGSFTYGFDVKQMEPNDYKSLMDCGWRRCGTYFYKSDMFKSCCRCYTIRMNVNTFEMKKSQKKAMKKWNKLIYKKEESAKTVKCDEKEESEKPVKCDGKEKHVNTKHEKNNLSMESVGKRVVNYTLLDEKQIELKQQMLELINDLEGHKQSIIEKCNNPEVKVEDISFVQNGLVSSYKILPSKCLKKGSYFTNYFMLFLAKNKTQLKGVGWSVILNIFQELLKGEFAHHFKDFKCSFDPSGQLSFFEHPKGDSHSKAINQEEQQHKEHLAGQTESINKLPTEAQDIIHLKKKKDQMDEEKDKSNEENKFSWESDMYTPSEIRKGRLTIKIQLAKADQQNFEMYQRYCNDIHEKSKESMEAFKGFLCQKTLNFGIKVSESNKENKLLQGCFHMNYFLDGEFIAVGVVDMFEEGLSSVYFFYEPKYQKYSLGVVAAVYEIEYIQKMSAQFPLFRYYYLGYYIQNCQKMVYKGDYSPSELLCPRTYKWYPLDQRVREFIDSNPKDPSLAPPTEKIDPKMAHTLDIKSLTKYVEEKTRTSIQGQIVPFSQFSSFFNPKLKETFKQIASVIDSNLYQTLLFDYSR